MSLNRNLKICFLVALETIFCFTPLGSIPIGPIVATTSMVPVIIAALLFDEKVGMLMGFVFGLYSFIYWTFIMPAFPTAFLFTPFSESAGYKGSFGSIMICFLPRILIGLTAFLVSKKMHNTLVGDIMGAIVGSLTNTILVITLIYVFFGNENPVIAGKGLITVLSATILTNGIPESILCAVVCPAVVRALKSLK